METDKSAERGPEVSCETKEKPVRFLGREPRPIGERWAPRVGGDSSAPTGDVITRGRVCRCSLAPPGASSRSFSLAPCPFYPGPRRPPPAASE